MKSPFPYFGGKATIAPLVWKALGQPKHYLEPFFGSGAVLLNRPNFNPNEHVETICDSNGFVCNVWRALQFSADETARWCDWPVNHADLSARKLKLIENNQYLLDGLIADPEWHDPKLAGYWIWAASCWIGSGLTRIGQIPKLRDSGTGVHAIGQIPHLSDSGTGVHAIGKRPQLSHGFGHGTGVHKSSMITPSSGETADPTAPYNTNIYAWFRQLSERLRNVRVVCGDWTRICGGNWQDKLGDVGIFFDPPYGITNRDTRVYDEHDSLDVAAQVQAWALERGKNPNYRIVLAGYEEHKALLEEGWREQLWSAGGGYANTSRGKKKGANQNWKREILYFSPYCYKSDLGLGI